jgi:AcrR family transcriptional regulator
MARRPAPDTRERILAVAARLFYQQGVRAVGLQQVIDETGMGKSLLYREFGSKDDLVAAWLQDQRQAWRAATTEMLRRYDGDPVQQLLALVEVVRVEVEQSTFRGCIFHNINTEFPDAAHPAHREAVAHLQELRRLLRRLARAAGADDPAALGDSILMIVEGMYASGAVLGAQGPARLGASIAETMIRAHCATGRQAGIPYTNTGAAGAAAAAASRPGLRRRSVSNPRRG